MTGQVVFADYRGFGEIRSDSFDERVPFKAGALVKLTIGEAIGQAVNFDILPSLKRGGREAVRVRRAITPERAA